MKVDRNIYYDERCGKNPFSVNIMREGIQFAKKFPTKEEAIIARDNFIEDNTLQATDDPDVFIKQGVYFVEFTVYKQFEDYDKAVEKAKILRKFMRI